MVILHNIKKLVQKRFKYFIVHYYKNNFLSSLIIKQGYYQLSKVKPHNIKQMQPDIRESNFVAFSIHTHVNYKKRPLYQRPSDHFFST